MGSLFLEIAAGVAIVGIIAAANYVNRRRSNHLKSVTVTEHGKREKLHVAEGITLSASGLQLKGREVSDEEMAAIKAERNRARREWRALSKEKQGEILSERRQSDDLARCAKSMSIGITHAIWLYSGAPCCEDPKDRSLQDARRDAAHKAADGQRYEIATGMLLDGKWVHPGQEPGCKCSSKSVIPALEN